MFRNGLEPWHLILVVLVSVLLFGYKRLPDAARGLGKSLRILKSETRALREDGKTADTPAEAAQQPAAQEALAPEPAAPPQPGTEPVRGEQHRV